MVGVTFKVAYLPYCKPEEFFWKCWHWSFFFFFKYLWLEKNPGSLLDATSWISSFLLCFYPYSVASLVTCSIFLPSFPLIHPLQIISRGLILLCSKLLLQRKLLFCSLILYFSPSFHSCLCQALLPSYNTFFSSLPASFFTRHDLPFIWEVLGCWSFDCFSGYWSRSSLLVTNHSVNCIF